MPVKNCFFVFCSPVGFINVSHFGYQRQAIQGPIPWAAATKRGAPDMCTNSFQGDTADLERARGRGQGRYPQASLVSREDPGGHLLSVYALVRSPTD